MLNLNGCVLQKQKRKRSVDKAAEEKRCEKEKEKDVRVSLTHRLRSTVNYALRKVGKRGRVRPAVWLFILFTAT